MRVPWVCLVLLASCVTQEAEDGRDDSFVSNGKADTDGIADGSPTAVAVLGLVNQRTEAQLHDDVGLASKAAKNIAAHVRGADHKAGTADDQTFATLAELHAVPYVGSIAFRKLVAYAQATGLVPVDVKVGKGILLDCNTSFGPDQQVTVIGDGTTLTLRELTSRGSQEDHPLTTAAWASHTLTLHDDDGFGAKTTLTKEDGAWVARTSGGGVNEVGDADCWVDTSPKERGCAIAHAARLTG